MGQKGEKGADAKIPQNSVQPPAGPPGAPGQPGFDGINLIKMFFFYFKINHIFHSDFRIKR